MQLTADDRQWIAEQVAQAVSHQFAENEGAFRTWQQNGGFENAASRFVIAQAGSMSDSPSGWCDLGQAVALAVKQSMNDPRVIRVAMDGIKAEERRIMQEATGGALAEADEALIRGQMDDQVRLNRPRYVVQVLNEDGSETPTVVAELAGALESVLNENLDLRAQLAEAESETMRGVVTVDTPADNGMHLHAHPARP